MYIKKEKPLNKEQTYIRKNKGLFQLILKWALILGISVTLILAGVVFKLVTYDDATDLGFLGRTELIKWTIANPGTVTRHYFSGLFSAYPEDDIYINVKHKDFQRIAYKRQQALAVGRLFIDDEDWVPATINYNNKTVKIKMRLKGDLVDHLEDESKWSYRIKVKGENSIMGMKVFSVQSPGVRGFMWEWLYHKLLKHEGLIALRYKFVNVYVNGKDLGIYALEEHFDKRLLEHNELREGPIVRFSEDLFWYWNTPDRNDRKNPEVLAELFLKSEASGFQSSKIFENPVLKEQYFNALTLLNKLRRKELKPSEVFDVDKYARFLAVSDLSNTIHGSIWRNSRFYYNPVTSLLEPVGYDGDGRFTEPHLLLNTDNPVYKFAQDMLLQDSVLLAKYVSELRRVSSKEYLDTFFASIQEEIDENLNYMYKVNPLVNFSLSQVYQKADDIRYYVNPTKGLEAHLIGHNNKILNLQLGNIQKMPVKVINLSYKDSVYFWPMNNKLLMPKDLHKTVEFSTYDFKIPEFFNWADSAIFELKVGYQILGAEELHYDPVSYWPDALADFSEKDILRQETDFGDIDFIAVYEKSHEIIVAKGKHQLNNNIIIPKGYNFIVHGNTTLDLISGAKIISYSPVSFLGSPDAKILIESSDSTGQGILVLNAPSVSQIGYTVFNNLANLQSGGWSVSGAVNFYESEVNITNSQFINNRSEDALNIIKSSFTLNETVFSGTQSDAFDGDFVSGMITNCYFLRSGNDAIDISGSQIEVRDVEILDCGDKGLSAGENSQLTATNITINSTEIAVASKDLSTIKIDKIVLINNRIGFTAFQKKPEFGSAEIIVNQLTMEKMELPYLIETNSSLTVDGKIIPPSKMNVEEILYGVEYGKSSK
jgi:hypothetical protein